MYRLVCVVLVVILFSGAFTGCYDRKEVDDLGYVIAIGLDKGKTNFLRMTVQFAVPTVIAGGGEEGGGGGESEKSVSVQTVEAPAIYSGLNMINVFISKQINLSHAKIIVFSKELAEEGLELYLNPIIRGREFRPDMFIVVSRGSAEEYIRVSKPLLEANPAKYYELNNETYRYTGFFANTSLYNFYKQTEALYGQGVASLVGTGNFKTSDDINTEGSTFREKGREYPLEGDFKAGDAPKTGGVETEMMGLAVFDGSRMVGELDGEEAMHHLIAAGEYGKSNITIIDPLVDDRFVQLSVRQSRKPMHRVSIVDGSPQIHMKVKLEADILSIQSGKNYESIENVGILEKAIEEFFRKGMLRYLEKTREMGSDICGFGSKMRGRFLTWQEWEAFNWLGRYRYSRFDVDVSVRIRRPGLMIYSYPGYSSEGKEGS